MSLEDHIGDVCRKARLQTQTPLAEAAALAGLSEAHLEKWETEGGIGMVVNVAALAEGLGLDAAKSLRVAAGWVPASAELGRWHHLRKITTVQGFEVNSYVAWDSATRMAAIFDTGWFAGDLFRIADENELDVRHLFITHMHADHVAAIGDVRARWPEIELHSNNSGAPERNRVVPGEGVIVGGFSVTARLTPGHSEDGVTYIVEGWPDGAPAVAMVGDAIFAGSMGKAFDTPELARAKVRDEVLTLPGATLICPGHGPLTTVAEEQSSNPFFR